MEDHSKPDIERYDEKSLAEVAQYEPPGRPAAGTTARST